MNKIIIELKNNDEFESLEEYLKQNGIAFIKEEEYEMERQKKLMTVFADMISNSPKADISEREIDMIVEDIRAKRYEENRS